MMKTDLESSMKSRSESRKERVVSGRFEIERDGQTASLEYNLAGNVLQLIHTEVPPALRGAGLATELAQSALDWARERGLKVDVICESVAGYINQHPEYADLVLH
jgi:predicted GNAT family acetyltransferase